MQQTRSVLEQAEQLQDEIVALRRQLHAHPELSFAEFNTAQLLGRQLESLGYKVRTGVGKTGVVADIGSGTTIAIRAEMDAVPVDELNRAIYSSRVAGVSHACGHDANMACVVAAAKMLAALKPPGRIRIIMQPAAESAVDENGKTGTARMIEEGALDGVKAIITLHVDATLVSGRAGILLERAAVSTNSFTITLNGRDEADDKKARTDDLVLLSAQLIQDVYSRTNSLTEAGSELSINSISSSVEHSDRPPTRIVLDGTFRTAGKEPRDAMISQLESSCYSLQEEHRCTCKIEFSNPPPANANSPQIAETMMQVACDLLGTDNVAEVKRKTWTEDFAGFTEVVPGALMLLGVKIADQRRIAHSSTFDIDESVLYSGAAILAETACRLIES
jgi:amidohydrolase